MENYTLFCSDDMSATGISEVNVQGSCKESIIQWWKDKGYDRILPLKSIKLWSE